MSETEKIGQVLVILSFSLVFNLILIFKIWRDKHEF